MNRRAGGNTDQADATDGHGFNPCLSVLSVSSVFLLTSESYPLRRLPVQENALPHFERQQLQDLQAVVLAPRKVLRNDAPHLRAPEEAAPPDHLFRQHLVHA